MSPARHVANVSTESGVRSSSRPPPRQGVLDAEDHELERCIRAAATARCAGLPEPEVVRLLRAERLLRFPALLWHRAQAHFLRELAVGLAELTSSRPELSSSRGAALLLHRAGDGSSVASLSSTTLHGSDETHGDDGGDDSSADSRPSMARAVASLWDELWRLRFIATFGTEGPSPRACAGQWKERFVQAALLAVVADGGISPAGEVEVGGSAMVVACPSTTVAARAAVVSARALLAEVVLHADCRGSRVDDAGLARLMHACPNMRSCELEGSLITDRSLGLLLGTVHRLERIEIRGTCAMSREGAYLLQQGLPGVALPPVSCIGAMQIGALTDSCQPQGH